jgi:dTDP-4-amino-4,6-dideoxygalactose transaminase
MYEPGTLHTLSFHRRKHLAIGRGGMILTDDAEAAKWLRLARYDTRMRYTCAVHACVLCVRGGRVFVFVGRS